MIDLQAISDHAASEVARREPSCRPDAIIIDASNLLYRLGHMNRNADETYRHGDIVIAFLEKIVGMREWYGCRKLTIVWEGDPVARKNEANNWRVAYLPEYKGGRDADSALRAAVNACEADLREILSYTIFDQYDPIDGEGDDGFATVAQRYYLDKLPLVAIYSTDRDLLQLADYCLILIVPQRGDSDAIQTLESVTEKLGGIAPWKIPDMKGLMGDPGDNIPGVPKIGPKIAQCLIAKHGSLEATLSAASDPALDRQPGETLAKHRARVHDELGTTVGKLQALREHAGIARISKIVGGIRTNVEMVELPSLSNPRVLKMMLSARGAGPYLFNNIERFVLR